MNSSLLNAAARLEGTESGYWPAEITLWFAAMDNSGYEIDASPLAALLRTIAKLGGMLTGEDEYGQPYTICTVCNSRNRHKPYCVVLAAEKLADSILSAPAKK